MKRMLLNLCRSLPWSISIRGCTPLLAIAFLAVCTAQPAIGQSLFPDAEDDFLTLDGRNKIKPSTFQFLKVSTNARVSGMGDAFTAVADGMDGIVWNPAGTTKIKKFGYAFGYAKWLVESAFYSGCCCVQYRQVGRGGGLSRELPTAHIYGNHHATTRWHRAKRNRRRYGPSVRRMPTS